MHSTARVQYNPSNVTAYSFSASTDRGGQHFGANWKMEQKEGDAIQPGAPCPQAEALLVEYHGAVRAYREAVTKLDADLSRPEFEIAYWSAEEARTAFELRREELLQHRYVHGCQKESV